MFYIFKRWEVIPNWKSAEGKGWKYKFKVPSGRDLSAQDLRDFLIRRIQKHRAKSGLWSVVVTSQTGFHALEGCQMIELGWVC